MRLFKRFIGVILVLCMITGLIGCSKDDNDQGQENQPTVTQGVSRSNNSDDGDTGNTGNASGNISGSTSGNDTTPDSPSNTTGQENNGVSGGISTLGTGSKTGSFELTGVKSFPADGIGTPGVDFDDIPAGEVRGWEDFDIIPAFNPLGDRDLYSDAWTDYNRTPSIKYLADDGYTPASMDVTGYYTGLYIHAENSTKNWVLYKAKELGADTIYKTDEKTVFFSYVDPENTVWFVYVDIIYDGYEIYEYSCPLAATGSTLKIAGDGVNIYDNKFYFCTKNVPGKQLGAQISFDGTTDDIYDNICVNLTSYFKLGDYYYNYRESLSGYTSGVGPMDSQVISADNIPSEPEWIFWEVELGKYSGNYEAYFTLNEIGNIEKITIGENPGMIKIKGTGGDIGAELSSYANISTSDWDSDNTDGGYSDNEGNYCFVAPAGYYKLELGGDAFDDLECSIQNIPVSSGRITEVIVPSELKAYTAELTNMGGSLDYDAGNMEIISVNESGDSVTVGIIVHDPEERDLFPENNDFTITENGNEAKVTNIEREPAGANVIMCIDSSGSIKKSLPDIIESACKFVENLPDNSTISIIEFKQNLIEHKGNTKEEAIKALRSITAKGDTSLYDSISRALDRLEGVPRAYVIAFTDGKDSREPGDPAPGSSISKEDLCEKIKNSNATVLGMGFGAGHDATTLKMISESSEGGQYYYVADVRALDGAFAAVQSKFGNQFKVTYTRPVVTVDEASDVPIVSIMMDTSRSMNMLPEESDGDVDIRIEKVRTLFHDFIMDLPDNMLGQFASFTTYSEGGDIIKTSQLLTDNKADLLKALAQERTQGGTPIQAALEIAYNSLKNQNSSKKVMVFFTDAALAVEDDGSGAQQQAFDEVLEKIKKSGIRVLFAGLGGGKAASEYDSVFKYAADKAGGDYIISSSVDDIKEKLNELLTKVDEPMQVEKGVNIFADLTCKAEDGSTMSYSAGYKAEDLTVKTQKGSVKAPSVIQLQDGGAYITYSGETSALLYGSDSKEDTEVTARITFTDNVATNQFADLSVSEAYLMPKFKGVDAGYRTFLALNVTLTFHKKDKSAREVGYQIPNIFNHFYVSLNNGRMAPASEATWLAETPFAVPGESSVQVDELYDAKDNPLEIGESISGILIFVVDEAYDWKQLSLHCYDTSYGHLEIPLVGALPDTLMNITALPKEAPADNIADSFSLKLTGSEDTRDIAGAYFNYHSEDDDLCTQNMRILEMQFESKVQALLDIDPTERFYYKIETNSGDLLVKMSDYVDNLPLGFTGGTKFAPASVTSVRLPYDVPLALKASKASLWGELRDGSFEMDVNSGSAYKGYKAGKKYEHEYFTLVINKLAYMEEDSDKVILDFTVIDKKDGEGTGGFDTMFYLYRDIEGLDFETNTSSSPNGGTYIDAISRKGLGNFGNMNDLLEPVGIRFAELGDTQKLIFGASDSDTTWGAYDGQARRGILIFYVPNDEYRSEWRLSAECLPDLSLAIDNKKCYGDSPLLTEKIGIETYDEFDEKLAGKVEAAVTQYRATHPAAGAEDKIGLSDDEIIGTHIETPYLTLYGTQVMESVKTIDDFHKVMQSLTWVPKGDGSSTFSPETVITQGYGFDEDFIILANELLKKLGYKTTIKRFYVTEEGEENLARFGGYCMDDSYCDYVYCVLYTDEKGNLRVYVPAFRHYAEDLVGLGSVEYERSELPGECWGNINITVYGEFTGDAGFAATTGLFDQFSDIFGGGDGEKEGYYEGVTLLDKSFNLANVGRNPMDISFISLGKTDDGINNMITAVVDTADGLLKDSQTWVSSGDYKFDRIEVRITSGAYNEAVHTYMLEEGDSLLDVFMSIAVNLPLISDEAASAYETALTESINAYEGIDMTDYGRARWTTHSAIARMAKAITECDADICEKIGLSMTTADQQEGLVCVCATVKSKGQDAIGSFDIVSLDRRIFRTEQSYEDGVYYDDARKGYTFALSSLISQAEGIAFPGGETYLDVWATMPEDEVILTIDCDEEIRANAIELYKSLNAPKYLIERLEEADYLTAFQMPTAPGKLHGEDHWAWLEINTETMETISVFDTGEHGMAAYIIGLTPKGVAEFGVGALVGVSCSVFAVSAYSLEYDDEEDIWEAARDLMGITLENVKFFRGTVTDVQNLYKAWGDKEKMKEFLENKAKQKFDDKLGFNITKYLDYLVTNDPDKLKSEPTFADGFEAAMKMYFGEWIDVGY